MYAQVCMCARVCTCIGVHMHAFTGSSLVAWLTVGVAHWWHGSLVAWLSGGSLVAWLTGGVTHWWVGSLVAWLTGGMTDW